ncbi:hypothetical protein ABZ820_12370 [Streptomyces diacarni]|uniref:hypothetical protein n=1 Tax=Streptomyces diacarni TaxID=2800381 RepID=UPI0033FAB69B
MPQGDDDEPVFKKSNWGTNRYVYNANNPIGLTLIILSVVVTLVVMFLMNERKGPFAPPKETPWSPSIDDDPTYQWDSDDETTPPSETPESTPPPPTPTDVPRQVRLQVRPFLVQEVTSPAPIRTTRT